MLLAGYSATTARRSTLFNPRPTTSNGRLAAGGSRNGIRTVTTVQQSGKRVRSAAPHPYVDLRLPFAYSDGRRRDRMLPLTKRQREILDYLNEFIAAARLRAKPRGNRSPLRAVFARDGPQAPDEPAGERLHQAGVEPEPVRRDGADAHRRTRRRAAAARVRRRRCANRGGGVERNDRGAGRPCRQAGHLRAPRPRRLDDRRADSRRRFRRRRGSQDGRQRRDGHRAAAAART